MKLLHSIKNVSISKSFFNYFFSKRLKSAFSSFKRAKISLKADKVSSMHYNFYEGKSYYSPGEYGGSELHFVLQYNKIDCVNSALQRC